MQNNTVKTQVDNSVVYTTLFAGSVFVECLQATQGMLSEQRHSYARNKAKEAEKASTLFIDQLTRAITKGVPKDEAQAVLNSVEIQKNIMYDFFLLDFDSQQRVNSLIQKIKREQQSKAA